MKKVINLLTTILGMFLIVFSISCIYSLYKLNIIKFSYIIFINIFIFISDYLIIISLSDKNHSKAKRIIASIFSLVLIIFYIVLISILVSTFNFIDTVTKPNSEYMEYTVLAKNKDKKISDLSDKYIGFITTTNSLKEKEELSREAALSYISKDYTNLHKMIKAFDNNEVSAIVVSSNMIESYKDNKMDLLKDFNSIYTFNVKISDSYKKNVNLRKPFIVLFTGKENNYNLNNVSNNNINTLLVVNPKTKKMLYINIPNTTSVRSFDNANKKDRIEFTSNYGVLRTVDVINNMFNINIDFYVKTNRKIYKSKKNI